MKLNIKNQERDKYSNVWVPYNKGGGFRRWYGNNEFLLRWINQGRDLTRARTENSDYYFKEGVTWSFITSGVFSCRYFPEGALWDVAGSSIFSNKGVSIEYICAIMNSNIAQFYFDIINPTINYQVMNIISLPYIYSKESCKIIELAKECISISKCDWDSFENSWDYERHPFVTYADNVSGNTTIKEAFNNWEKMTEKRFLKLKENEEEINRLLIYIYSLTEEITSSVLDKNISINIADLQRDIKSFISFAVGCMFGRYSLDAPGLVYAGGTWDPSKYTTFTADEDAILPICDDEYFEDDIVGLFISFVEKVYGKETLEENLQFIADALGGKGTSREVIRNYFINGFYADHVKVYQKRPIYWLFDSGKKNGFKCLIYLHRYKPDTIARIRTDYIHEQQSRYRTAIEDLNQRINGATASDKVKLGKKLAQVQEQAEELRIYEEKIHHLADQMIEIDLDDGVKVNYAKFQDVLAKIK